ncbi:hypothetical protein [Citrobacter werkmanii]|uniref:hypothetical protein n=1 Tax=Citrobacter werkmanii TaxID=67827 RepID=UPI003890614D
MGSNIIELAKLGHERAAELKASCGAVDVRSVAQLISDLATQLEVQFVRSTNMAVQLANAESKCRELAAENAHMQQVIGDVQTLYYESDGIVGYHLNGDIAKWDDVMPDLWAETPDTDAFLAEVRASALPVEIAEIIDSGDLEAILFASGYAEAEKYRMALYNFRTSRKGVQS